ncbi:MAG: helix-turn-helix transcriptional regulator [Candidatus Bathyarchaeia archaeon]
MKWGNIQKPHDAHNYNLMIPILNVDWHFLPTGYSFNERDTDVLSLIEKEDLTMFTFDGLKRRCGIHPETLSRILTRLEDEGIIKKSPQGYNVTPKITKLKLNPDPQEENTSTLLQTYLPSDLMTQQVIDDLKGRWFGLLRWLGMSETCRGVTLKWVTDDGGIQIAADIQGAQLNIEAKFLTNNNLNLALKAAYQLMNNISKLYQNSKAAKRTATYLGKSNFMPPA